MAKNIFGIEEEDEEMLADLMSDKSLNEQAIIDDEEDMSMVGQAIDYGSQGLSSLQDKLKSLQSLRGGSVEAEPVNEEPAEEYAPEKFLNPIEGLNQTLGINADDIAGPNPEDPYDLKQDLASRSDAMNQKYEQPEEQPAVRSLADQGPQVSDEDSAMLDQIEANVEGNVNAPLSDNSLFGSEDLSRPPAPAPLTLEQKLAAAQKARAEKMRRVAMLSGANDIAAGFAKGAGGKGNVVDLSDLRKLSGMDVQDLEEQSKAKKALLMDELNQLKLGKSKREEDPNSSAANALRPILAKKMKLSSDDLEGMTASEMLKLEKAKSSGDISGYQRLMLGIQQERLNRQGIGESRRKEVADRKRSRDLSKDITSRYDTMKKDTVYKEMDKQGVSFDQADVLINQIEAGNEIALGALGTKMARAMGEVGVLTDKDVERYIMAQSLVRKAQDKLGKAFMGGLSDSTLKDIKEVTSKMAEGFSVKKDALVKEYVDQTYENFGKDAGLSRDDIYKRMFGRDTATADAPIKKEGGEEIRRKTKDGRIAIFDKNKKFLRYEE